MNDFPSDNESQLSRCDDAVSYDFITEIDRISAVKDASSPEISIGIMLWPEFPLLALAGLIDSLRHAADFGDNSHKPAAPGL